MAINFTANKFQRYNGRWYIQIQYPDETKKNGRGLKWVSTHLKVGDVEEKEVDRIAEEELNRMRKQIEQRKQAQLDLFSPTKIKEEVVEYTDYDQPKDYIYFFSDGEFIKIGRSNNVKQRRNSMQAGSPRTITMICTIPCKTLDAGKKVERILHNRFAPYHIRGEWYDIKSSINETLFKDVLGEVGMNYPVPDRQEVEACAMKCSLILEGVFGC